MDEERLIVALEARIRDFERNMAKAERQGTNSYQRLRRGSRTTTTAMERDMIRSTSRINQALASTSSRIGAFGKAFAATAVAAGIGAITTGAVQAIRSMAEIKQQADRAGLSVQAFQQLQFVSEQSRIGIDNMVDGLKELQLRADEFIVTGKGAGADAFKRLGYDARDLARRLEEPEELFLDIVDRLEDLDRAAQIRIADEVFGGTGGERFVELLSQGDEGIRKLMDRANELGLVLDEEAIAKAAELDRKFAEIASRVSALGKSIVVNVAGAIEDALTIDVDEIFGSAERAIAMMGGEAYRAMKDADDATEEQIDTVEDLQTTYEGLFRAINAATGPDGLRLMDVADVDEAHELAGILQDIDREMRAFQTGATSAGEFEEKVGDLIGEAQDLIAELDAVDAQRFGNVVEAIGGMAKALATAAANAATLRDSLPTPDTPTKVYSGRGSDPRIFQGGRSGALAPGDSPRPRLPSVNHSFGVPDPEETGGGGGGGSRQTADDYQREIEAIREKTARLEAEAVALAAVAAGGQDYGDAVEYARTRAELLMAAQKEGKAITPELKAEIDQLAAAYTQAGVAADDAADHLLEMEENAQRGADRMTDLFMSIMDGSMDAKEALAQLLMELARVQIQKAFLGLADSGAGGGFVAALGGLLSGGRATGGPVRAGSAYLVNERTPRSEVFVPSQSGGVLNVPQAQAALRGAAGAGGGGPTTVKLIVEGQEGPFFKPAIRAESHQQAVQVSVQTARAQTRAHGSQSQRFQQRGTMT
ncbi:hypothetical protein [Citreimonas salinaria]|uniref:Phage tail tape measure protein, lambda family n=1 Tax=Citreimonas salinaria TaxID=321339 RepID=A0A1H3HRF3_9RHOB|nr:hypothetical protein [Citreimonas salinaria]SDY18106.1 hypothetical protein SAMN05444340_104122 [Citreimonas salinaria]